MSIKKLRKMKKVTSLFLVIIMLFGMIPGNLVFADELASTEQSEILTEAAPEETAESEQTTELSQEPEQTTEVEDTAYANSISGMLWIDMKDDQGNGIYSGNGIYDVGERPLTGYKVSLYLESDKSTAIQTETTNMDGKYKFTNIEPGSYVVGVISETVGDTEYLLPLTGITDDNKFAIDTTEWVNAYTDSIEIKEDTAVIDITAGMRTPPKIQPMAADETVSDFTGLQAAINSALSDGTLYEIEIGGDITFTSTLSIPAGKNISIYSTVGSTYTLTYSTANSRHFTVRGIMSLSNIILDGDSTGGGMLVRNANGTLIMETGAVIRNCNSNGNNSGGGVYVDGGTFTMNGGEISGNAGSIGDFGSGGGVYVNGGTFTMNDGEISGNVATAAHYRGYGGGVCVNGGMFTMNGGEISGNTASTDFTAYGGGVCVNDGTFDMYSGEIRDNTASSADSGRGGGIFMNATGAYSATFIMRGGEISDNTATIGAAGRGGGISAYGSGNTITMNGGKISDNTASEGVYGYGGGIDIVYGTFTMNSGEISGNTATTGSNTGMGGGLCVSQSSMVVKGGKISNNTASANSTGAGGGIVVDNSTIDMSDVEISNNIASENGGGNGGGINVMNSTVTMNSVEISNNTATKNGQGYGGGVCMIGYASTSTIFNMNSGEISGNYGSVVNRGYGGGVYSDHGNGGTVMFTMEGGKISGNITSENDIGNGGGVYLTSGGQSFVVTGTVEITDNKAQKGHGGGIYTSTGVNYANIIIPGTTVFSGNVASVAYVFDGTPYSNIDAASVSISFPINFGIADYPLNNYDINYTGTRVPAYTVTYDANGGTGGHSVPNLVPLSSHTVLSDTGTGISRSNYTLSGWNTAANGSGTAYASGTSIPLTNDTTLYAQWKPNSYNITIEYKDQSGTVITPVGALTSDTAAHGSSYTALVPSIIGYVLTDWQLDGIAQTNTAPTFTMPAADVVITLVYSQSGGGGSTGGGTTGGGTTGGAEDILITKKFQRVDGVVLKPDQTVTMRKGDSFNEAHDDITGYDYTGYKIASGAIQTGRPNLFVGSAIQAVITITGNTTVTYIYKAKQYNITVKAVDENGKSIENGFYDWSTTRGYKESFDTTAPTIKGYTYQYWKLNGTQKSGKIAIASVEADADILLVYKKQADDDIIDPSTEDTTNNKKPNNTTGSDKGNYQFIKKPNVKNVTPGETVAYTFTGFGNQWSVSLEQFAISDRPDKGLDFVSANLPAFTKGSGVIYDVYYITNLNGRQTLQTGVSADSPHTFYAPKLTSGEYITAVTFEFGTVPAGFAVGNSITMTFRVWDNPPGKTLTNIGVLSYKVNGKNLEFTSGKAAGTILIDGYFDKPKTGDNSNVGIWFALMGASFGGILLMLVIPQIHRRKRQKCC